MCRGGSQFALAREMEHWPDVLGIVLPKSSFDDRAVFAAADVELDSCWRLVTRRAAREPSAARVESFQTAPFPPA